MKYFSSDRPTAAARQGREAVEEFAVRAWIGAGSDKDPNVIAVDLHAVHLVVRRSNVGAGDVPLHTFAWTDHLQTVLASIVQGVFSTAHQLILWLDELIIKWQFHHQLAQAIDWNRQSRRTERCTELSDYITIKSSGNIITYEVSMALGKQAKIVNRQQIDALLHHVGKRRNGLRNQVIVLLSVRAGLRAKEIASLKWKMIVGADGEVGDYIHLTNDASKGQSGRIIPINRQLRTALVLLSEQGRSDPTAYVISTERSDQTSAQAIVNLFQRWYRDLGLIGCSSHSGRRTFITNAARKISTVGGSLRDVQHLAGHSSLQTTQRYIEGDSEARKRVVELV